MTERSITYSSEFKTKAIKQSLQGMTATQIFELAGLPFRLIGEEKANQSLSRWKNYIKDMAKIYCFKRLVVLVRVVHMDQEDNYR